MFEILATKNDQGRTLYKLLCKYLNNLTKSRLEKIFRKKDIKVNGIRTNDKSFKVSENDHIIIYGVFDANKQQEIKLVKPNLNILYEDDNILLIDKVPGLIVHGEENSLDDQVLAYLGFVQKDSFKPSHVGRLDKATSGLILYAKNYETLTMLNAKHKYFTKKYLFKSNLELKPNQKIDLTLYLVKDEANQKVKAYAKKVLNSQKAQTLFYLEKNDKIAQLVTGRKHQIRVSLQYLHKPIWGDKKYGGKPSQRLMLHSFYLQFKELTGNLKYLNKKEFWTEKPKW